MINKSCLNRHAGTGGLTVQMPDEAENRSIFCGKSAGRQCVFCAEQVCGLPGEYGFIPGLQRGCME